MKNDAFISDEIKVSVICNTYNHEKYIRDALESFVTQKTNFRFEVLVHDDASSDGTADIIREYEQKYPDIIKPIYQSVNLYSKKIKISKVYQYPRAKGKYLAICEGDDYWIDNCKLQKQYDALESRPDINICTCCTEKIQGGKSCGMIAPSKVNNIFTTEDVILGGGGFVGTNSIVLRKEAFMGSELYDSVMGLDYFIQIIGAIGNGMLYLSDCMCVYRVLTNGSWTSKMNKNRQSYVQHLGRVIENLKEMDTILNGKYHETICQKIHNIEFKCLIELADYKSIKTEPYLSIYNSKSFRERIKLKIKEVCSIFKFT